MKKLWEKSQTKLLKEVEEFEVGDDYKYDNDLLEFDIITNIAYAKMLGKIGVFSRTELASVIRVLRELYSLFLNGKVSVSIEDEDVHSFIENYLTKNLGDTGKKIHTGRSRNDQVLNDIRLYLKDSIIRLIMDIIELANIIVDFAQKYSLLPMAGYTHMQRAMPSTVGMWISSFAYSLVDDMEFMLATYKLNNKLVLGSAAGYGSVVNIDRRYLADIMGFDGIVENSLYCQNSRGKVELAIISAISQIMLTLNKLASDIMLFTTREFAFFSLPPTITTGSSIMPQKFNPDIVELIRARSQRVIAMENELKMVISSLPSGYNRDLQETKSIIMDCFKRSFPIINITKVLIKNLIPIKENLINAIDFTIFAADRASEMALKEAIPFRDAYKKVAENLNARKMTEEEIIDNLKKKRHIGAPANIDYKGLKTSIKAVYSFIKKEKQKHDAIKRKLLGNPDM